MRKAEDEPSDRHWKSASKTHSDRRDEDEHEEDFGQHSLDKMDADARHDYEDHNLHAK